jgi:hypothetical protein
MKHRHTNKKWTHKAQKIYFILIYCNIISKFEEWNEFASGKYSENTHSELFPVWAPKITFSLQEQT